MELIEEGVGESSSPPRGFLDKDPCYDIKNDIYARLVESENPEAISNPDFRIQLDAHFSRLPTSYGVDINVDRAEVVLLHQKLLEDAKDPVKRPAFHVRFMKEMERSSTNAGKRTDRGYTQWTTEMDIALSNALLEQHSLGNKTPNGWKMVAFTAAIAALKDICGVQSNREKVVARLKTWNKYYVEVSAMLSTSGFGWDWERNIVQVDSEEVWRNYVQAHPDVKHYRDKVIVNWGDLAVLCGTERATGGLAGTTSENVQEIYAESTATGSLAANLSSTTHNRPAPETDGSIRTKKAKGKGRADDAIAVSIQSLAYSVSTVVSTKVAGTSSSTSQIENNVSNIINTIEEMTDLDKDEVFAAWDILGSDPVKYAFFMKMPTHYRRDWLRRELMK